MGGAGILIASYFAPIIEKCRAHLLQQEVWQTFYSDLLSSVEQLAGSSIPVFQMLCGFATFPGLVTISLFE